MRQLSSRLAIDSSP